MRCSVTSSVRLDFVVLRRLLFEEDPHHLLVVGVDFLQERGRVPVQALAAEPEELFIGGADVLDGSIVVIREPKNVANVLGKLIEAIFGTSQLAFGHAKLGHRLLVADDEGGFTAKRTHDVDGESDEGDETGEKLQSVRRLKVKVEELRGKKAHVDLRHELGYRAQH